MEEEHEDHGNSVAAWTLVAIVLLGCVVAGIGVVIPSLVVGIIGAVIVIIGLVAGKVLSMLGYGKKDPANAPQARPAATPEESGSQTFGTS